MIYAIVMAGGRGTRLEVDVEKPLFKFHNKPLIKYVLDNLSQSKLIEKVIIAVSPHTPETAVYVGDDYEILDTPGKDYLNDLSFILDYFEKKSCDDILLFINADLPFISSEIIDCILNFYLNSPKDALSTYVPVKIFKNLGLDYSYECGGNVPSGLNILKSKNIIQDEDQLVLDKVELAFNINSLKDAKIADSFKNLNSVTK